MANQIPRQSYASNPDGIDDGHGLGCSGSAEIPQPRSERNRLIIDHRTPSEVRWTAVRRRVLLGWAISGLLSIVGAHAADARGRDLRFNGPVSLPGAAGSSESRVAVASDGTEYVVSGPSTDSSAPAVPTRVYVSHDHGRTWHPTPAQPVQVSPTPDTDIVVTRSGRIVVVELDDVALSSALVEFVKDVGGRR